MERLDAVICQFLQDQKVPGATLAVTKHGRIVYQQGYGVAGAGCRMRANMALRVASISKLVTAMAVLHLCQEGRLSLDAKVFGTAGILKQLKPRGDRRLKQVTVCHLLQHSAGWDRDVAGDAVFKDVAPPHSTAKTSHLYSSHLLQHMLYRKLQFTPGTRHAYSNMGYLVLGEVIEAVTGQTYESYVKSLLALIGITDMYVGCEERASWLSSEGEYFNIREPATAASVMPGQADSWVLPQYGSFLMRNTGAFGGWVATAGDIVRLLCSLEEAGDVRTQQSGTEKTMLNASSFRAMLERPSYETGQQDWYGLGLDVQDGGNTWGHTGAMEGTSATCQRHHSGLGWALVLNAWSSDMDLDGVVKSALSRVPDLSPFPLHVASLCGRELLLTTADEHQLVMMFVPLHRLLHKVQEKSNHGLTVAWVGVNTVVEEEKEPMELTFNVIFSKSSEILGRRKVLHSAARHLAAALKGCCEERWYPELITTYWSCGSLHGLVVLAERPNQGCVQEVDVCVPASQYISVLTKRKKSGFRVVSQCATHCRQLDQLVVTAIMERNSDSGDVFRNERLVAGNVTIHTEKKILKMGDSGFQDPADSFVQREHDQWLTTEHSGHVNTEHFGQFENEQVKIEDKSPMEWEAEDTVLTAVDVDHTTENCLGVDSDVVRNTEDVVNPTNDEIIEDFGDRTPENKQDHYTDSIGHCEKEDIALGPEGNGNRLYSSVKDKYLSLHPSLPSPGSACRQLSFGVADTTGKGSHSIQDCQHSSSKFQTATAMTPLSPRGHTQNPVLARLKTLSYVQMEVDSFVTELGRQVKRGCGLQNVHFFPEGGAWYVSGVWSPQVTNNCYHRMGVSALGLLPALAEAAARSVLLRFVCHYQEEGVTYYALFWEGPVFDRKPVKRGRLSNL